MLIKNKNKVIKNGELVFIICEKKNCKMQFNWQEGRPSISWKLQKNSFLLFFRWESQWSNYSLQSLDFDAFLQSIKEYCSSCNRTFLYVLHLQFTDMLKILHKFFLIQNMIPKYQSKDCISLQARGIIENYKLMAVVFKAKFINCSIQSRSLKFL